ncbi:uncharacterized protein LOC131039104 [Cryptomeria japonica]|uniref:uncharacterized protein LOC131039104 n=1 Tax=Cryptomeria japonica TaxID=3369 RepID=UPI0027DA7030|nr:uncharacterized protein LOC131039104 [Cryptomeria japonica]
MGVSDGSSDSAFRKGCDMGEFSGCIIGNIFFFGILAYGCLPIVVIAADVWSAFRKRKHWIPADSLVLGALALQFVAILKISFDFSYVSGYYGDQLSSEMCDLLSTFASQEIHVLSGRVSVCVLMGCLLPGVARPLSASLWSDMAALIISSSIFLFQVSYEAQMLQSAFQHIDHCEIGKTEFYLMQFANAIIIVSIIFLVLILGSGALASVTIPKIISPKIPVIFSPPNFHTQFGWEKVEEQVTKSWIVVRTSDPQYIITRSCLSSSVALIISACNGVLVCQILVFRKHSGRYMWIPTYIESGLRGVVIVMGSLVIYWRCITQVMYYPKTLEWRYSSFSQYFQIEDFWKTHLLGSMRSSTRQRQLGRSCLLKIVIKLCRVMRFNRLLHVLYWLQMFSILFSKFCCLLSQLLFSNKYFGKLIMGSAYEEFSNLYRSEIQLGQFLDYSRYLKALVNMQGENSAGLWVANRKSISQVKKQMEKGEEEGKQCGDLISLIREKSSPDLRGEKCVKPQNDPLNRLQVERELDVRKFSWKMSAISIIAVIIELSAFTHDEAEAKIMLKRGIEACSQAWNIMEVVENNAIETVELSIEADEIFERLQKKHKWLEYSLPLSRPVDKSPAAAKAAIQNLVEKGKEIANQYCSSKPSEAIAGYSLYRIGRVSMDQEHQFNSVGEICDRMCRMLADVMGSCCVKAAGVIMEDCKKLASMSDEENILRIARVAGRGKGVTESVGWTLKWSSDAESTSINTSLATEEAPAVRRYHTFQIG